MARPTFIDGKALEQGIKGRSWAGSPRFSSSSSSSSSEKQLPQQIPPTQSKLHLAYFASDPACINLDIIPLPSTLYRFSPYISYFSYSSALPVTYVKMPSTQTLQPRSPPTYPIGVPRKTPQYTPLARAAPYSHPAISPPQPGSSVNTSAVPSLTSGSYSGSTTGDENSNAGASGVDLVELLNDRLSNAVDPLPLDRSLAKQAQTWVSSPLCSYQNTYKQGTNDFRSGELNAKHRELLELQALAQRRLKGTRTNIANGMQAAKEVKRDLEWTQKRVS